MQKKYSIVNNNIKGNDMNIIYTLMCCNAKVTGATIIALMNSGKSAKSIEKYGVHYQDVINNIDTDYVEIVRRDGRTYILHKRKPEQFVVITDYEVSKITGRGKLTKIGVYTILKTYMNAKTGEGFPSLKTLARRACISERQVIRIINSLCECGLLQRKHSKHTTYIFNANMSSKRCENVTYMVRKCHA